MQRYEGSTVMASLRKSMRVFLLGTSVFLAGVLVSVIMTGDTVSSPRPQASLSDYEVVPTEGNIHSTFTAVASRVRPAVVYIKTERSSSSRRSNNRAPFDFFRDMLPEDEKRPRGRRATGGGSGFIIDKEGRILTNYHVIREADRITVVLGEEPNEREFEASVVGFDALTDIAIIRIDANEDLPVVALGDSDEMLVGDWVMAIGTPFGQLSGSVTVGVVSAKGRTDLRIMGGNQNGYQNFIQTDASINFGNSGGPLVNLRGEAIGINTAINPTGQGIGFAIPINMARRITAQLIASGRVQYGFMGIQLQELTRELAQGLDLDIESGILVRNVLPDTPAEEAGLQSNDVIVEYDGHPVRDDSRFRLMVGNTEVGRPVSIKLVRDGKEKEVTITLTERPQENALAAAPPQQDSWLGLHVDDLDSREVRNRFDLSDAADGVIVIDVDVDSPASDAGIRVGDVITEVYSQKVGNLKEYVQISEKLKNRKAPIAFLVKRRGASSYVPVVPDKE